MVFMPPRHSKSETISRLFTAYLLYRYPDKWIGLATYGQEFVNALSRESRENYRRIGLKTREDSAAVKQWETLEGGGLFASGIGGSIVGKGFSFGIIDDPIKDAETAASDTYKEKAKDWYGSVWYTRQEPDAALIILTTRWTEEDLAGYLLEKESGEFPEHWHIVNFEAIKEKDPIIIPETCTLEPDARKEGDALCPPRFSIEKLNHLRSQIGEYSFSALYQQRPSPRQGLFFNPLWFEIVDAAPATNAKDAIGWDLAATKSGGDYTVGLKMRKVDGVYYILDMVHFQEDPHTRDTTIYNYASQSGKICRHYIEQEGGSGGKAQADAIIRMLAGYTAIKVKTTGSKELRADPFASQAAAGNVKLVKGSWNELFLEELRQFPRGKHDDIVDATTIVFNKLAIQETVTR